MTVPSPKSVELRLQPKFPARCSSCGGFAPHDAFRIRARRRGEAAQAVGLMVFGGPWMIPALVMRGHATLLIPACAECSSRDTGLKSARATCSFVGTVLAVLGIAAVVARLEVLGFGLFIGAGVAVAAVFAITVVRGLVVPMHVRAYVEGAAIQFQFDDAEVGKEFARLNLQSMNGAAG